MKFELGDVVVVTGPLTHQGELGYVDLIPGEVADVVELEWPELPTTIRVFGRASLNAQYIDKTSLTPFSEIDALSGAVGSGGVISDDPLAEDPQIDWGLVHDYVWEDEEE